jgi:WD40 repeat protein
MVQVFLYDVTKRVVVRTIQTNKDAVYRVAWNPRDATLLACAGQDGNCVVTRVNGQVQRVLKHAKPVFGCAWSPFETATIATACGDGNVYVWHIAKPDDAAKPWATLVGHKAKVFNVAWSPLLPDMLLSGSDDRTARVWRVSNKDCQVRWDRIRTAV